MDLAKLEKGRVLKDTIDNIDGCVLKITSMLDKYMETDHESYKVHVNLKMFDQRAIEKEAKNKSVVEGPFDNPMDMIKSIIGVLNHEEVQIGLSMPIPERFAIKLLEFLRDRLIEEKTGMERELDEL